MEEISEAHLWHALHFALGSVKFPVKRRFLEDVERDRLARAIVDHLKLCHWHVMHEPVPCHSEDTGPS